MVQPVMPEVEHLTARITFHAKPSVDERLNRAVAASPWDRPQWLRHWLENTLARLEMEEMAEGDVTPVEVSDEPLAVQLAAAKAQIAGLEQVNTMLNERLGMADAQNIELNKRLESSITTVERFTLALPAPETGSGERGWWPFRRKRRSLTREYITSTPQQEQTRRVE